MRHAKHISRRTILAALSVILVLAAVTVGAVYAKYIRTVELFGNVTVSARLADGFALFEHTADRQTDGSYRLNTAEVKTNTYTLLPGLDVPKDPQIRITGKTATDAYLFVEVVDGINSDQTKITYALNDSWTRLDGVTGGNGGAVYVYSTVLDEAFGTNGTGTVEILKDNTVYVSQWLNRAYTDEILLTFHAYMAQTVKDKEPSEVFELNFKQS